MFRDSVFFVFLFFGKEFIFLFEKDALNWSNMIVKIFLLLKVFYFKSVLLFWTFYTSNNPEK